jgi:hypothetical protein
MRGSKIRNVLEKTAQRVFMKQNHSQCYVFHVIGTLFFFFLWGWGTFDVCRLVSVARPSGFLWALKSNLVLFQVSFLSCFFGNACG